MCFLQYNYHFFTNEDLLLLSKPHNRPLFMTGHHVTESKLHPRGWRVSCQHYAQIHDA